MNDDPQSQSLITQFIILFILTALTAMFSASEMALVSINRKRVEQKAEEGDKKSIKIYKILQNPNNFLATIQVGITVINILAGASLAESLSYKLSQIIGFAQIGKTVATFIVFILLTYVSIVFGELYPKRIALNLQEKIANFAVVLITFLGAVLHPFVWLLSASTNLISRLTPMKFDDKQVKMTKDEMEYMLSTEGTLEKKEVKMLQGVFSLDDKVAREVMVPRTDSFMIDIEDDVQENIKKILTENFSRIPVYENDKDKVIGVLHTKRLLMSGYKKGFDNLNLRELLQEPLFVPETIYIDDLLYELKRTQNQIAILLDEYSGVVGIVTLEDLLEEIVGDIEDETDEAEKPIEKISSKEYLVKGSLLIENFNEEFGTQLKMDDVDTIAGYFITAVGLIPAKSEVLSFDVDNENDHLTLVIEKMEGTRILVLRVIFRDAKMAVNEETLRTCPRSLNDE
ncbi:MAG: hemolysin family protein [Streptococcaceae bacterium]|jgi:putative hemolysin|nr:hemolysin family protein [Streptococcaceae bacterium]